jgi:glycosyltransferase involved in cell wall biosynthesis
MKILIVSRWLWEERRRNDNKTGFFGELFQAIAAKGIDLTILTQASGGGPVPERRPIDGLNVYVFSAAGRVPSLAPLDKIVKFWSGYRKAATDARVIRRFIRKHGPFDAVIAQCEEPDGLACALARLAGFFPPLITAVHDLRYEFRDDGTRFVRQSSLQFVFRHSDRVIANSAETAGWLYREYHVPEHKIGQARIHLTAPFLEQAKKNSPPDKPTGQRVLFLGALNQKKAPDVFLRAAAIVAPESPKATFVLVGPETSEDTSFHVSLKKLSADPRLASRLEMPGRLDTAAVIDQIRCARVVVCPSRIETFSRTTIEALALDRPVIVTETTGAAHWVKSTGCGSVVPPDNPAALARAIRDWLARTDVPPASATVTDELTAARAADDWAAEIARVVPRPAVS